MKKSTAATLASGKYVSLRFKELSNGRQSLYLHIYQSGKRKKDFLNLYLTKNKEVDKETLRIAKALRAQKENDILSLNHEFVPAFKKQANFVAYFKDISDASNSSPWKNTYNHLKAFTNDRPLAFKNVTPKWLEEFQQYLLSKVKRNSAVTYYARIKAALNRAVKEKIIPKSPARDVPNLREEQTMREYLVLEEIQKLSETACRDEEVKKAFLFAVFTGLRISDVRKLTWQEVHSEQLEFKQKKTKHTTYIPLPQQAKVYLGERGEPNQQVFKLVGDEQVRRTINNWRQEANITKKITFHCARHTYATLALTFGVDIYTVKELLGHADIRITQIYAKIINEKKRLAVNLLPVLKSKEEKEATDEQKVKVKTMKNETDQLKAIVKEMVALLTTFNEKGWAKELKSIMKSLQDDQVQTCRQILALLKGGMGSINDVVLYQNGQPLVDKNNKLAALRSRLYDKALECMAGISSKA